MKKHTCNTKTIMVIEQATHEDCLVGLQIHRQKHYLRAGAVELT
jgi:hypothetical protein